MEHHFSCFLAVSPGSCPWLSIPTMDMITIFNLRGMFRSPATQERWLRKHLKTVRDYQYSYFSQPKYYQHFYFIWDVVKCYQFEFGKFPEIWITKRRTTERIFLSKCINMTLRQLLKRLGKANF